MELVTLRSAAHIPRRPEAEGYLFKNGRQPQKTKRGSIQLLDEAESRRSASNRWSVPHPKRRTHEILSNAPVTAPKSTPAAVATARLFPSRAIDRRSVVILMPAVLYPFNYITSGVIKSERIRPQGTYWCGLFVLPLAAAANAVGQSLASSRCPTSTSSQFPRAQHIPFSFSR